MRNPNAYALEASIITSNRLALLGQMCPNKKHHYPLGVMVYRVLAYSAPSIGAVLGLPCEEQPKDQDHQDDNDVTHGQVLLHRTPPCVPRTIYVPILFY